MNFLNDNKETLTHVFGLILVILAFLLLRVDKYKDDDNHYHKQ